MGQGRALYDGILAEAYDLWLAADDLRDVPVFRGLATDAPGPSLELGCGTGRVLVPMLAAGLDVEGLDASRDMLRACREKAAALGFDPVLHVADMADFDLGRRYGAIFSAVASLSLLTAPGALEGAIAAARRHLVPGGRLAASMDRPRPSTEPGTRTVVRDVTRMSDGMRFRCVTETLPPEWPGTVRYRMTSEALGAGGRTILRDEATVAFRCLEPDDFAQLVSAAGFSVEAVRGADGGSLRPGDDGYLLFAVAR